MSLRRSALRAAASRVLPDRGPRTGGYLQRQWLRALSSVTIGMVKGVLMEREGITDAQAFNLLVSTSKRANTKLHDLAARSTFSP
jgi:hypothetical protein